MMLVAAAIPALLPITDPELVTWELSSTAMPKRPAVIDPEWVMFARVVAEMPSAVLAEMTPELMMVERPAVPTSVIPVTPAEMFAKLRMVEAPWEATAVPCGAEMVPELSRMSWVARIPRRSPNAVIDPELVIVARPTPIVANAEAWAALVIVPALLITIEVDNALLLVTAPSIRPVFVSVLF